MKNPITLQQVKDAHNLVAATITTIFNNEKCFIDEVLKGNGWSSDVCTIERCHAALRYRITLKHDDGREKDLYITLDSVYDWLNSLEILGE